MGSTSNAASADISTAHASMSPEDGGDPSVTTSNPGGGRDDDGTYECDAWTQTGCLPGEKCAWWGTGRSHQFHGTRCVSVAADPAGAGEPCTVEVHVQSGIDDCDADTQCWYVEPDTLVGECVFFCRDPMQSQAECACVFWSGYSPPFCMPMCDPIAQDCKPGRGCYPITHRFVCLPHTVETNGEVGAPCMQPYGCRPGLLCAQAHAVSSCVGASHCCTTFCDTTDPQPCPEAPAQVCVPWNESIEGLEHVGVCAVPN